MISGPNIRRWFFTLFLLTFLPTLAAAQVSAEIEPQTVETDQRLPASYDPSIEVLEPVPEPNRGYLIELIVFENTQHLELGKLDNNDYTLPDDRPTNRTVIYPSIPDELYKHLDSLQLNAQYQPIAYTSWRQVSKLRSESPRFQLNEIAPSLTGTVMVYDNVILLSEIEVEYNPALGTAATNMSILDIPEYNPNAVRGSSLNNNFSTTNQDTESTYNEGLASNNPNIVPSRMFDPAGNPIPTMEQAPYTGKFYPSPFSTAQSYVYLRVSRESARYLINEKRRVKFEETHYFDHPAFGILLRVIRTEIPVDEYNLSTVEALGVPPFSTARSATQDPSSFLESNLVSPNL
jgi:hypothetical protein